VANMRFEVLMVVIVNTGVFGYVARLYGVISWCRLIWGMGNVLRSE